MLHVCVKNSMWRRIWKILQNFLETERALVFIYEQFEK
jgi:hypothetical protein